MKFSTLVGSCASAATLAHAYPGMNKVLSEIKARQENDTQFESRELIGDLLNLTDSQLTPVGRSVKNIITDNNEDAQSNEEYPDVPPRDTPQCAADTCCIWHYISADMASKFRGQSGRCTDLARQAVRMGFHDAAGFSKATGPLGGADGSIILAGEMARSANRGMEDIAAQMQDWFDEYKEYGASMADLIQMASTTATVVCPLGPRVRSFVGRKDSSVPAPDGLLPSPFADADNLISLFQNKTIEPNGLIALIGAHTTSQQRFVDPARAGDPQDSTPGVWDVLYYKETLASDAPARVFKFPSDINLSKDPRTAGEFQAFAGPGGQQHWNEVCFPLPPAGPFSRVAKSWSVQLQKLILSPVGFRERVRATQSSGCL
jgi:manganese peroxidase